MSAAQMTELVRETSTWAFRLDLQESNSLLDLSLPLLRTACPTLDRVYLYIYTALSLVFVYILLSLSSVCICIYTPLSLSPPSTQSRSCMRTGLSVCPARVGIVTAMRHT